MTAMAAGAIGLTMDRFIVFALVSVGCGGDGTSGALGPTGLPTDITCPGANAQHVVMAQRDPMGRCTYVCDGTRYLSDCAWQNPSLTACSTYFDLDTTNCGGCGVRCRSDERCHPRTPVSSAYCAP